MITIEEDIAKSAHWHTIDDGAPWRDVCYRLAMEVERLRSIIAAPKAEAHRLPEVGDTYVRGTARVVVVAVDETQVSYKIGETTYKYTIAEFVRRASRTLENGAQFIPAQ